MKVDEQELDGTTKNASRILLKSIAAGASVMAGGAAVTNGTTDVQADELVGSEKNCPN